MNVDNYIQLLTEPYTAIKDGFLEEILETFPYFQSARALQLKKLYQNNSYKYNNALKKTAAYTIDRQILFEYITSKSFKTTVKKEVISKKSPLEIKEEDKKSVVKKDEIKTLELGKPLTFNTSETHSFNQWMQLISTKPIAKQVKKESKKNSLIDQFISTSPKIKPVIKTASNPDISIESTAENESLMTETLAKVYLEQKKYSSAIKAYKILSLKYPEKSGFFANRIKAIEKLQKYKS